jgi:hypothetical protein
MTYWATLWYAGSVVITLGSEGQTLNDCNMLGQVMMYDIATAYADPTKAAELAGSVFPTADQFSFTCETQRLPTDKRYME